MVMSVVGVGYEGRELAEFVEELVANHIDRLVDVRLTPLSRKRGFSKTALCEALSAAGIAYEHRPQLGNPKENRRGFGGTEGELKAARDRFRRLLETPAAVQAVKEIAAAARRETIALLCFEADPRRCHRALVLEAVHEQVKEQIKEQVKASAVAKTDRGR